MSSLLCDECKNPVCDWKHAETAIPFCDTCLFRDDSKGQPIADSTLVQEESASPLQRSVQEETASPLQGSVQEERTQSSNVIVTSKNNENGTKYNPKSPDNMVINKCLPPRETEDTHFQDLSLKPTRLNGLPETPIPAVVGNLGINLREDVSYQSVSLPLDKEAPSFIPKTDWKKTQKLFKQPKDEFQSGSVTYETDKAQQEMLECPIQLTTGTLKKEQSVHPAVETDCHQEMQPVPKLMMEHDPKQRYSAQEAHCYIEVQQKNEQRLCFKSVQATDHALKLKAKQQDVAKEKQVSTEEMFMQKSVPETAITILQADTGPVKKRKKLHDKITPYTKPPPALAVPMTPVQELNKLHQTKEQKIQYSIRGEHHGGRVVQSGVENHSVVRQPDIPQTVTILDVSNQQPLSEDLQREMQPVFPTPALFEGEDIVDDIGDGLFESNHQILRQVTDDSSSSRAFDENEVPVNVPNIAFQ